MYIHVHIFDIFQLSAFTPYAYLELYTSNVKNGVNYDTLFPFLHISYTYIKTSKTTYIFF